jgi:hypothetical protein
LSLKQDAKTTTTITIGCDNPDCKETHTWIQEDIGEDTEKLPDGAFRFLILAEFIGQKWMFCSKFCMLQWLKNYKAPKSPKEIREAEEAEKKKIEDVERMVGEGGKDVS